MNGMRYLLLFFFVTLLSLTAFTCEESGSAYCEDEVWLDSKIAELKNSGNGFVVKQYQYNNQNVFLIDNCLGCADAMQELYDCAGNSLCLFGGIAGFNTCPDFYDKATFIKVTEQEE